MPAFKVASNASCENDWEYDSNHKVSIHQCKSFWRKLKKFFKEAAEVLKYVAAGLKSAHDIKHTYDNWNKKKGDNRDKDQLEDDDKNQAVNE